MKVEQESIFGLTVEQFRLHTYTISNGMRLIDFVAARNMAVCSTKFQHLDIHKATWMSSDRSIFNQIDHIVIDGSHVSSVLEGTREAFFKRKKREQEKRMPV